MSPIGTAHLEAALPQGPLAAAATERDSRTEEEAKQTSGIRGEIGSSEEQSTVQRSSQDQRASWQTQSQSNLMTEEAQSLGGAREHEQKSESQSNPFLLERDLFEGRHAQQSQSNRSETKEER